MAELLFKPSAGTELSFCLIYSISRIIGQMQLILTRNKCFKTFKQWTVLKKKKCIIWYSILSASFTLNLWECKTYADIHMRTNRGSCMNRTVWWFYFFLILLCGEQHRMAKGCSHLLTDRATCLVQHHLGILEHQSFSVCLTASRLVGFAPTHTSFNKKLFNP